MLIVDDAPFNLLILQEIFQKLLTPSGCENKKEELASIRIDEANNGLNALNLVKDTTKKT